MSTIRNNIPDAVMNYSNSSNHQPLFILGDSLNVLRKFADNTIDCCVTSPPYWGKRQYHNGGVGLESDYRDYVSNLLKIFDQLKRVLKPTGSFWLNIGDSYLNKNLLGIPWRVGLALSDTQGWILRNDIIWNKLKGNPDNTNDRLRNMHEFVFHFVKRANNYYYDLNSVRSEPKQSKMVNGSIVSATGVSGVRYIQQITKSKQLNDVEKKVALKALEDTIQSMQVGKIADFRMIIRGQQRATHSDSSLVSGRARELQKKGFYFLKYHPNGSKPGDVWSIVPEDTQNRKEHFAPFPEDLCRIPILTTCPQNGIVLDPFCGTGTAMLIANKLGRKSIGIDKSSRYLEYANKRCVELL